MIRVEAVQPLHGHSVRVAFSNGKQRDIDVTRYIDHGGIFTPIYDDPVVFRLVRGHSPLPLRLPVLDNRMPPVSPLRQSVPDRYGGDGTVSRHAR